MSRECNKIRVLLIKFHNAAIAASMKKTTDSSNSHLRQGCQSRRERLSRLTRQGRARATGNMKMFAEYVLLFLMTNMASSNGDSDAKKRVTDTTYVDRGRIEVSAIPFDTISTSTAETVDVYNKEYTVNESASTSMDININAFPACNGTPSACVNPSIPSNNSGYPCNRSEGDDGINDEHAESYLAYRVGVGINRFVLPVIIAVGTLGNFVSMCVMFQRQNRHMSFTIYLGCLAISDNCVLLSAGYYWGTVELHGRLPRDDECRILIWILETFQSNGVLLILGVTLDRLVAVCFPLKAAAWCRARRAKVVSASVFAVVAVYNIPHLVLNHADERFVCMLCRFDNILCVIHLWVTTLITFAIPLVLLLAANTVIILAVRNSLKYKHSSSSGSSDDTQTDSLSELKHISQRRAKRSRAKYSKHVELSLKDRNLIVMLLLVSFMFLLLNAPRFIRIIIFATVQFDMTPERVAMNTLAWHVTNKLYFTNNACNFVLYCLSGSKFRRDFTKLFRDNVWRHCTRKTSETSSNL